MVDAVGMLGNSAGFAVRAPGTVLVGVAGTLCAVMVVGSVMVVGAVAVLGIAVVMLGAAVAAVTVFRAAVAAVMMPGAVVFAVGVFGAVMFAGTRSAGADFFLLLIRLFLHNTHLSVFPNDIGIIIYFSAKNKANRQNY